MTNYPDDFVMVEERPQTIVEGDIMLCGHDVKASILEEMGDTDYFKARCHHCKYENGDITEEMYVKLKKLEENNDCM